MANYKSLQLLIICSLFAGYFFLVDRPVLQEQNVTSTEPFQSQWELISLTDDESNQVDAILSQPFSYLGEGGQMIAFASSDQRFVLKFFKFQRFRPSSAVKLLKACALFPDFCQKHISKRSSKRDAAFSGYKLAYELHRKDSGIVHLQLNPHPDTRVITLLNSKGSILQLSLNNVPYVLQEQVELLGAALTTLFDKGDVTSVKWRLSQLQQLYNREYSKSTYDLDHGIMHNIGCSSQDLVHLDVGKLVYRPDMKPSELQESDWPKICAKVKQWVTKNYPQYADEIIAFVDKELQSVE